MQLQKGQVPVDTTIRDRAVKAAEIAIDKKAKDPVVLDLKDLSAFADYMVVCSGDNTAQVKAIADAIDEYFSREKIKPIGREGKEFARWILLDYGDFVVNIFHEEARGYYELERLWKDAPIVPVDHK